MATIQVYRINKPIFSISFQGQPMLSTLLQENGLYVSQPCGGKGTCAKCNIVIEGDISEPNEKEKACGERLSCQIQLFGDCKLWLEEEEEMEVCFENQTSFVHIDGEVGYGIAVDIGTTTVALSLHELQTGKVLAYAGRENPQRSIAADVMGRIQAVLEGKGELLQSQIIGVLFEMMEEACEKANISFEKDINSIVITGNTTMLYILTGKDPKSFATAPFIAEHLFDEKITLLGKDVYLPPCFSAFVGADITCSVLASDMCTKENTALLCDIGTNGEIALWKDGKLHVCSTAAGPAFEEACIVCGAGGVPGAINQVELQDDTFICKTIENEPAIGICGSGLIDAIAVGLALEEIEDTGAMDDDEWYLTDNVYVASMDVRNVQLAKAAIHAGILALLDDAGIEASVIENLLIAGGFGSKININNAIRIGMFPQETKGKEIILGNAALRGAQMMLLSKLERKKLKDIIKNSKTVELASNPVFQDEYIEQMMFS